jgi:hypothetical protein
MTEPVSPEPSKTIAIYRPRERSELPSKALARIGQPVVEIIIQIGDDILGRPIGFAVFPDGETVLASPEDFHDWDGTVTIRRTPHRRTPHRRTRR